MRLLYPTEDTRSMLQYDADTKEYLLTVFAASERGARGDIRGCGCARCSGCPAFPRRGRHHTPVEVEHGAQHGERTECLLAPVLVQNYLRSHSRLSSQCLQTLREAPVFTSPRRAR